MSIENTMEQTGELTPDQRGAIEHSIRIGGLLVNEHPEIARMYREGMYHVEIAEFFDVKGIYVASDDVAIGSVHHAITGHTGGFGTEPYDGLIQDLEELAKLRYEHRVKNGRRQAETRGQIPYVKKEATNHTYDEIERAYLWTLQPEYQHQEGPNKGKGDINKIRRAINDEYHHGKEIRGVDAMKTIISKYRKSL